MAKQSFADIFEQWEKQKEAKEKASKAKPCPEPKSAAPETVQPESRKSTYEPKLSFADIYSQWSQDHDDSREMDHKSRTADRTRRQEPSISQLRGMSAQDELDLHEMPLESALIATKAFLEASYHKGLRKVRIITGKGLHSKKGEAVLRPAVTEVAQKHSKVREVYTPKAAEGGSGALSVILKSKA